MSKQIFIDVETTGLDEVKHGLVQVAGAIVIDGVLKESFNYSMCPPSEKDFEPKALEVIGLSTDDIECFDESDIIFKKFHKMLCKYISPYDKKDKLHFIAYNSPFDSSFIRQWFIDNNNKYYGSMFWTPDICVLRKAGDYLQDERSKLKNCKLETVCNYFDIKTLGELHNAMTDVVLMMKLYNHLTYDLRGKEQGELNL